MILLAALAFAATPTDLIPRGAVWSYLDSGVDPGPDWATPSFDDSAWASGPAPLGYGVFELTTLGWGTDPLDRHVTTWFRAEVDVPAPGDLTGLSLELRRDDGAVVYLNGVEIHRDNLPSPSTSGTFASSDVFGLDESTFTTVAIDPGLLVTGPNTVAVEVHQSSSSSDDLAFDLALVGWTGPAELVRGPYLQNATPTSVVVRFRTDLPTEGEVVADGRTFPGPVAIDHAIEVDGLAPDTPVTYSVGTPGVVLAGGGALHTFTTPPLPGSPGPVRIWAIGDAGTADAGQAAVRDAFLALGEKADVWLMLGDNAYNSGTDDEYQAAVFDVYGDLLPNTLLWPTLGNHDGYTASSASLTGPYYDIFTLPTLGEAGGEPSGTEAYYSFDYGPVHVVCLDSYDSDRSPGSAMLSWLEDDLARTTATWIVAYWHHPPYSYGSHNSDFELQMVEMRENVLPILEAWGVDLVLTGHSHSYERSVLLDGHYGVASTLSGAMVRDGGDGDPQGDGAYTKPSSSGGTHEGAVYVVAGASGKISGGPLNHPAMFTSLNVLGSMIIDADATALSARYLDDAGAIRDAFTIERGRTSILEMYADGPVVEARLAELHAYAVDPQGDEVVSYAWDFGDGQLASGADVTHLWPDDGVFDVVLTVVDRAGATSRRTLRVEVLNLAPVLTDVGAGLAEEGRRTALWAEATDVPADTVSVSWDFGDGSLAFGDDVEHVYLADGTYTVTVTASDEDGGVSVATFDLQVADLPPEQQSIYVSRAEEGRVAVLVAGNDPEAVAWSWDFHDGLPPRTTQATEHVWPDDGAMPVTLTVTDAEGVSTPTLITVDVANVPPGDLQVGAPAGGAEGAPLVFVAHATDPGDDVLSFTWTFGEFGPPAVGTSVEHRYGDDGPFTVRVVVDDGDGGTAEVSFGVDVVNVPPTLARLTAPSDLLEGSLGTFSAVATDPADPVTIRWDLGDGTERIGSTVQRAFPDEGVVQVVVEADDGDGGLAREVLSLTVHNVAPTLGGEPATEGVAGAPYTFAPTVTDPGDDALTFTLVGPEGATVGPAGVVRWVPERPQRQVPFALTVSDGAATATLAWTLDVVAPPFVGTPVAPAEPPPGACGCGSSPGGAWLAWLGLGLLRRRR